MRTFLKDLLTASLLLASMSASAQCVKLEERMKQLISEYREEYCTNTTINETRDPSKPDRPLQSKCEIYNFTLKKKSSYQRELLEEMIQAMETYGREDPNFYGINTMSGRENAAANRRRLMIGEGTESYVEIGKDHDNYLNVNILDAADSTKTHRYAYAVEWSEREKNIYLRYIVTYAKIPSSNITSYQATVSYPPISSPFFDLGKARVKPGDRITIKGPARFQWDGKDYPIEKMDSVIRDAEQQMKSAEQRMEKNILRFKQKFQTDDTLVLWADTLAHDTDPVTDVVIRLQKGSDVTANDLLCNENILLIFSQLKQQYLAGENTEFNAISIYTLCKKARECGFFTHENAKAELEQLKSDINDMISKTAIEAHSQRGYLQMAYQELEKILHM